MTKLYIIQSYNTNENDIYTLDPDCINNVITDNKKEAVKICEYINEYNETMTGANDLINSNARIVEIDLGNTVIDPNIKFDTYESVKHRMEE
jgi:hypothetical protein